MRPNYAESSNRRHRIATYARTQYFYTSRWKSVRNGSTSVTLSVRFCAAYCAKSAPIPSLQQPLSDFGRRFRPRHLSMKGYTTTVGLHGGGSGVWPQFCGRPGVLAKRRPETAVEGTDTRRRRQYGCWWNTRRCQQLINSDIPTLHATYRTHTASIRSSSSAGTVTASLRRLTLHSRHQYSCDARAKRTYYWRKVRAL